MYRQNLLRMFSQLTLLLVILGLAACSGDDLTGPGPTVDTTTGTGGTTGDGGGTVSGVRIGSTVSGTFTDGVLLATPNAISAGGTSIITVELVDETGATVTTSNTVTFSSPCVTGGTAGLSNPSYLTTSGTATTNYTASGCTGSDVVTATLSGTTQTATGTVTVASAAAGSLEHTSSSNLLLALKGTGTALGLPETSVVTFTVKSGLGTPVAGEFVEFTINGATGGITLSELSVESNGDGIVTTTLQSGDVATNVRVIATLVSNPDISTTSGPIDIATGPPDTDSIHIGPVTLNPNVWNVDEKEVIITVGAGDRFNHSVTDGTLISFRTELGRIDESCTTLNGSCSVLWHSGTPRSNSISPPGTPGVTTIIAFVEGEESFLDNDDNGIFSDDGATPDGFIGLDFDTEEAYIDENGDGSFTTGEKNIDFNSSGDHDYANGLYSGIGCTHSTLCDLNSDTLDVWASTQMVLAEDNPRIIKVAYGATVQCDDNTLDALTTPTCALGFPTDFNTASDGNSINFTVGGTQNEQILPAGSIVSFATTNGEITAGASQIVPDAVASAGTYTVFIASDNNSENTGHLTLKVALGDSSTVYESVPIAIDDRGAAFNVNGTIQGKADGADIILLSSGSPETISTNAFSFGGFYDGDSYAITIGLDPAGLKCTVIGGSGTIDAGDASGIVINCVAL